MDIKVRNGDTFRIVTNQDRNFIDVNGLDWEGGIRVDAFPTFHYIEMREKEGQISTFYFQNKRAKKEIDLGWWDDAAIIFSRNDVHKSRQ